MERTEGVTKERKLSGKLAMTAVVAVIDFGVDEGIFGGGLFCKRDVAGAFAPPAFVVEVGERGGIVSVGDGGVAVVVVVVAVDFVLPARTGLLY